MNTSIFTVGSVTYAVKARKILSRAGISSRLVKVDGGKSRHGCTYGIEFAEEDLLAAVMELKRNGIAYEKYPAT